MLKWLDRTELLIWMGAHLHTKLPQALHGTSEYRYFEILSITTLNILLLSWDLGGAGVCNPFMPRKPIIIMTVTIWMTVFHLMIA